METGVFDCHPLTLLTGQKVHDFLTVGAAAPLQEAAVVALNFGDDYYENLKRIYTEKRIFFWMVWIGWGLRIPYRKGPIM